MRGEKSDHRSTVQWCVKMVRYVSYINIIMSVLNIRGNVHVLCSYTDSVSPCATSVCLSTYALVKSAVFINRTSLTEHSQQCFLNIDSMFISYTCVRDTLSEMAAILCVCCITIFYEDFCLIYSKKCCKCTIIIICLTS